MRVTKFHLAAAVAMILATAGQPALAKDATVHEFAIVAQPLNEALNAFAQQADLRIVFDTSDAEGITAPALRGKLTAREAIEILLGSSRLTYRFMDDRTIAVGPRPTMPVSDIHSSTRTNAPLRLAETGPAAAAQVSPAASNVSNAETPIAEVVVTAQKRIERLQDVPVPVSVVRAEVLVASNQVRLQDYYTRIPGLSLTSDSFGQPVLAIRGLTTGTGNPTVGITVDDLPYGSITGFGRMVPDIDPNDLAQIEVLRGPQGTLYGASSIGGLLKFVTADPRMDQMSGRVQVGISSVKNGSTEGYNARGSINLPLGDTWAVRASGFTRRDPGYVDDPVLGEKGVNEVNVDGGRLTALWQPSDAVSVKLGAYLQNIDAAGSPAVHELPGLGELEHSMIRDTGGYERKVEIYSANVHAEWGPAELNYIAGYGISQLDDRFDYTAGYGPLTESAFGTPGTPLLEHLRTKRLTQELRLSVPLGERIDGLFGVFYSDENTRTNQHLLAADPMTGAVAGEWMYNFDDTNFREYAGFADITFRFTDRFNVQVGGRQSKMKRDYTLTFEGPFVPLFLGGASPLVYPRVDTKEDAFTYLLTPQFKVSDDHMVYARFASGYRPGGPNYNVATFGLPPAYDADKTRNYDLGAKGSFLERSLTYDISAFYIDWQDIQLLIIDSQSGAGYYTNASAARSRGVELALEWRSTLGLTLSTAMAWTDAELTEAFPASSTAYGREGDPLPFTSKFSGNVGVSYDWSMSQAIDAKVGTSVSFVGERKADFTGSPGRQVLPSYSQFDANAELTFGAWTINLFGNNLTDKRGLLGGGIGSFPPYSFNYIQPRTFGVALARSF
jgi:outer membrane receptor protein involved in Fe transport